MPVGVCNGVGSIVKDITFDSDFDGNIDIYTGFVITIGETTYLAFNGSSNNEKVTVFYKIDRTTQSIKKVMKAPATMRLSPTIASRNSTLSISFSDSNENGSDIVMTSTAGVTTNKVTVPAGQQSATLQANVPAGIYCVSRMRNNKAIETKKVVVR